MLSVNIGLTITSVLSLGGFGSIVIKYVNNKNSPDYIFLLKLVLFTITVILTTLTMGLNYGDLEMIKKELGEKSKEYKQQVAFGSVSTILLFITIIFAIISIVNWVYIN